MLYKEWLLRWLENYVQPSDKQRTYSRYPRNFDNCHMPIERYILKWYNDYYPQNKMATVWWELNDDVVQTNIKTTLGSYNPFLAEFYSWAEYNS